MNIAIIAPSGAIDQNIAQKGIQKLQDAGHNITVMPHVFGYKTSVFSATDNDRAADMACALSNPEFDVILCARGGYGAARTLDMLGLDALEKCRGRWLIGFSDITVFHAALTSLGIPSLHGPMLKHIANHGLESPDIEKMLNVINGQPLSVECAPIIGSRPGSAEGIVVGGNLSLLLSLRGTKFDIVPDGKILFIEDLAEYNYHIDRMIRNLRYSGILERISGLVVGQMTDMKDGATAFGKDAYSIIADAVADYNYPVLMGYPAGHDDAINMPLIMGKKATLTVGTNAASLVWD